MIRWVLALSLLGMPAIAQPRRVCADHTEDLAALVGKTEAEARAALSRLPDIRAIPLLGPGQPATMDLREDRVTGVVRDRRVEQIGCE